MPDALTLFSITGRSGDPVHDSTLDGSYNALRHADLPTLE